MDTAIEDDQLLPKVPVPELQDTLDRYLRSIRPLLSHTQFLTSQAVVEEFGRAGGVGETLQTLLMHKQQDTHNWVLEYWLDDMYLKNRLALPVNSSPALVFPLQPFKDQRDLLLFTARLLLSVSEYKNAIHRGVVGEQSGGLQKHVQLSMDQYQCLFNSYRRAGHTQDNLINTKVTEHAIIACREQFFVLNMGAGPQELSEADVLLQLEQICDQARIGERSAAVGLLTSDNRTHWAQARQLLLKDPVNAEFLHKIESCMCIVCVDQPTGLQPSDANRAMMLLHGGGPDYNGGNRWYDKTLQLVVCMDGACGVVCEHSALDGIVLVQCVEKILKNTLSRSRSPSTVGGTSELPPPYRLEWRCLLEVQKALTCAAENLQRLVGSLELQVLDFKAYGKELIKQQKMSPDAFIQLALQLAFYRCHKRLVSTYESASLRRFRKGRVENIRSATAEALAFVKAMTDNTVARQRLEILREAVKVQTQITFQAVTGAGIDNHLLALREIAKEMKMEMPQIFKDEAYRISNCFILSTSQVPTRSEMFCCYGPVVPDGYGCCYNPQSHAIRFCISSLCTSKAGEGSMAEALMKELDQALMDMMELFFSFSHHTQNHPEKVHKQSRS